MLRPPRPLPEASDITIIMVPDTPHVAAVLFGENGVAEGLTPGKTVIDMSSISPVDTKVFAKKINDLGCEYVDAPVSGGEVGAKAASLTIMCGGSEKGFATAKPLFDLMGKNITLVGGNGDGQTCKVANQIIVALNIEAVSEALLFASKAGADPAKVREALMGGFASSKILEIHGERMIKRTFDPGFRIELHQKDLNLALSNARAMGISLPNTATAQELFNACSANGGRHGIIPPWSRRSKCLRTTRSPLMRDPGSFLRSCFDAAIASAQPSLCIPSFLPEQPPRGRFIVIGAGKASAAMAKVVEEHWKGRSKVWWSRVMATALRASASKSSRRPIPCRMMLA